jgi:hypothetical protein
VPVVSSLLTTLALCLSDFSDGSLPVIWASCFLALAFIDNRDDSILIITPKINNLSSIRNRSVTDGFLVRSRSVYREPEEFICDFANIREFTWGPCKTIKTFTYKDRTEKNYFSTAQTAVQTSLRLKNMRKSFRYK